MKNTFYILLLLILCCCVHNKQPKILDEHCEFDLEKINFAENVPLLYSKYTVVGGINYTGYFREELTDEMLQYSIGDVVIDALNLKMPKEDFGYRYVSPTLDSVARFQNVYFRNLSVLTNMNKVPVAFYAECEFKSAKEREMDMNAITEKYGKPKHAFLINREFNHCFYEWELSDRTIQIETSHGFSISVSSDNESSSGMHYNLEILIVDNKIKEALNAAHVYEFSKTEEYTLDGKSYTFYELGISFERICTDRFFLHSSNPKYFNENQRLTDEYSIERAIKYEE